MHKDLIVIGAGPGGYEVAIKACCAGLNVALIEKEELGGTCLNHGCIPTKALYKSAQVLKTLQEASEFGFPNVSYELDFSLIQKRKNEVVAQLKNNIKMMLDRAKVEVIKGEARFIDDHTVTVLCDGDSRTLSADYFIIATGSVEKLIPISGYENPGVLTSKEILDLETLPEKLVVIGGGVIGVEIATIFQKLGTKVTIYEYFDRILPLMDQDISSRLKMMLKKQGVEIVTDALVERIEKTDTGLLMSGKTKKGKPLSEEAQYVLMATGRKAYYDNLNLDKINVIYDKSGIIVNENMQTSVDHIYAVGDVTGSNMLAHVATFQSFRALDHILNKDNMTNFQVVPACVFTFPEVATVGLTEEQAVEKYVTVKTNKFLFRANGKAVTMGEVDGFVKVISHDDELIGCHIIGPDAASIIQSAAYIIEKQIPITSAVDVIHAHPTLPEAVLEALRGLI